MADTNRREILKLLAALPVGGFTVGEAQAQTAHQHARQAASAAAGKAAAYTPQFFTAQEWQTVRLLADIVIPKDERSGSATDALVPEFMDFILRDPLAERAALERNQTRMRGGLAWLDLECGRRFAGKRFVACSESERTAVLDDIAYPRKAKPEYSHAVAFFTAFRDLTATGFWSSKLGVQDIGFKGNTFVAEWNGCPPEVLKKIGLDA